MNDREADTDQERQLGLASVGATLAAAREEQQRSLDSVAADLHLQPAVVGAIERGDEAKLPASTFLRGYVRSYARLLGLDDTSLIAQLPLLNEYRPAPLKRVGIRRSGVSLPRGKWLLWSLLLAALAVMIIYGVPAVERLWSQRSSEPVSDQLQLPLAGTEESEASPEPAESVLLTARDELPLGEDPVIEAEVPETDQSGVGEALVDQSDSDEEKQSEPTQALEVEAEVDKEKSSESHKAAPQVAGPAVIQMRFLEDSWVEMEANGRKLVVGTQPAGSERTIRAEPPIKILLGNAPGVEITYRGEAVDIASHQRGKVARLTLDE
ncbi:MAG: RodZ domain-containing protein [Thiogranum sp.]